MRNGSDKRCRGNQNTHFVFSNFFRKSCSFWGNVEIYCRADRPQMKIERMRIARWITKATHTHTHTHTHTPRLHATFIRILSLLLNIFAANMFTWKPPPVSATCGCSMLCSQRATYHDYFSCRSQMGWLASNKELKEKRFEQIWSRYSCSGLERLGNLTRSLSG